ncbi:MAG: type III secretion system inner membrane ring subunit SctD [Puniceicoccales bacterium]|jgi:type III secretion system YscD/HrpQ family protein|nr:type III secretion system inner membrane ring subunit SctD [Puniceicoccales bacterium]
MSSEHLLKILSGNHQGAEVVFGDESVIIGNGGDSDIVLSDSMIEPHHAEMTFSSNGVTIKPLDGQVFVDGKLVKTESQVVEAFQFITIGSTHIVFGPAGEPWPNISAMDAPTLEHSSGEISPVESQAGTSPMENFDDAIKTKPSDLKKIKSKRTWIIGISSAFVFAFALSLLIFLSVFHEEKKPVDQPDAAKLITNKIREMGLSDTISLETDGTLYTISGYTDTNAELTTLRTDLPKITPRVKIKLYSEEHMIADMRDLMINIPSNPKIECIKPGIFLISGYVCDKDEWDKIRRRIMNDIPGLIDIQDEVILPQKAINLARPILTRYKLLGKVAVLPQSDGIAIGGLVASDEEENWKLAKIQLERTFGPDITLTNLVKVSDPEVIKRQYFGSEVDSISISENGLNWIGFKNGTKYMVGSTLSNGYIIKEITPDTITLMKNNQTVVLRIGDIP